MHGHGEYTTYVRVGSHACPCPAINAASWIACAHHCKQNGMHNGIQEEHLSRHAHSTLTSYNRSQPRTSATVGNQRHLRRMRFAPHSPDLPPHCVAVLPMGTNSRSGRSSPCSTTVMLTREMAAWLADSASSPLYCGFQNATSQAYLVLRKADSIRLCLPPCSGIVSSRDFARNDGS